MRSHIALLDHPCGFAEGPSRHHRGSKPRLFDPISAIAMAAATIGGGIMSSNASKSAANTQANAARYSADLQQNQFDQTRASLQPFINSGYGAQTSLNNLLGIGTPSDQGTYGSLMKPFGADEFQKYQDPGYQFQLQQGQNALQNSQAAGSGVLSGAALKDLVGYNQGMANTAYQNAFGRYMSQNDATYNRLSSLLGVGENAAAGVGNIGAQTASSIGNTLTSGANAQAAGQIGSANAYSGALGNMSSMYMMNKMFGGGGTPMGAASSGFGNGMDMLGNGAQFTGYA